MNAAPQTMLEKVAEVLAADPQVEFGYLFGSAAEGKAGPLSDVDVAVWLAKVDDFWEKRLRLMGALQRALSRNDVDVVILNEAPLVLRYEVQRKGKLVNEKNREGRIAFEVRTRQEFWDFEPRMRYYVTCMKQRLEAGTFGIGHRL